MLEVLYRAKTNEPSPESPARPTAPAVPIQERKHGVSKLISFFLSQIYLANLELRVNQA